MPPKVEKTELLDVERTIRESLLPVVGRELDMKAGHQHGSGGGNSHLTNGRSGGGSRRQSSVLAWRQIRRALGNGQVPF